MAASYLATFRRKNAAARHHSSPSINASSPPGSRLSRTAKAKPRSPSRQVSMRSFNTARQSASLTSGPAPRIVASSTRHGSQSRNGEKVHFQRPSSLPLPTWYRLPRGKRSDEPRGRSGALNEGQRELQSYVFMQAVSFQQVRTSSADQPPSCPTAWWTCTGSWPAPGSGRSKQPRTVAARIACPRGVAQ